MSLPLPEPNHEPAPRFTALIPFIVFVIFYLGLSLWSGSFYKVPMITAFVFASAFAFMQNKKVTMSEKVEIYASGMGNTDIMIMCMIFILAGAFATVAKGMGAVDAAVAIAEHVVPARFMLAGLFLVSCFISLAIGTSCGTIAALTPIAIGLVETMNCSPELVLGAVIGGAMFGDNMSMISDTTIAATRTQGVAMRDKFFANLKMIIPAAVIALVIYLFNGSTAELAQIPKVGWKEIFAVLPYIAVFVLAIFGVNVMGLLFFGTVFASVIGACNGTLNTWSILELSGAGTIGMAETLIVAILAGGMLKLIRFNGGISFVMQKIASMIHTQRACEFGITGLVAAVNLFTANNTVAIVIAGPLAKELSEKFRCDPKRIAGLLDTASCAVQGIIPYGAQVLIAIGVAKSAGLNLSSIGLLSSLYYPFLMAIALVFSIIFNNRKTAKNA